MKSAVDSNVLFDLLAGEPAAAAVAEETLDEAVAAGPVVICPVVEAELAVSFADADVLAHFLRDLTIASEPFSSEALWQVGAAWATYARRRGQQIQCPRCGRQFSIACPACGSPVAWRQHLISDFLIGGHALAQADVLITRDIGYYRTYFPRLRLIDPTKRTEPA